MKQPFLFLRPMCFVLTAGAFFLLFYGPITAQEVQKMPAVQEVKLDYLDVAAPHYPDFAREHGWEGLVILKALVLEDGTCSQVSVEKSSGYKILDNAAAKAVKKWKFTPARTENSPYIALTRVPVRFVLMDSEKKNPFPAAISFENV